MTADDFVYSLRRVLDPATASRNAYLLWCIDGAQAFSAGVTSFQPGVDVPLHSHNVEEMVIILEGAGECELDGVVMPVKTWDTTYVPAGVVHCFRNTGSAQMSIMWVYGSTNVTRTFASTGETVPHLSDADRIGGK